MNLTLGDVRWAVDEPTLVTPLAQRGALVVRLGHAAVQGGPLTAFLLRSRPAFGIDVNGERLDLGDRYIDFLNLLEEADAVGIVGVPYYSDPFAA